MADLQFGKKPLAPKISQVVDGLPWNHGVRKPTICAKCGTNESTRWHSGTPSSVGLEYAHKDYCDYCWRDIPKMGDGVGAISSERKLEMNLPKNHFLGPKKEGVRGVFERVRR